MICPGLHCDGCGKGKITAGGVLALACGIAYLTHRQEVNHAADDLLEWMLITLIVLVVAGVVVVGTAAGIKLRARHRRMLAASEVTSPNVIIMPATITPTAVAGPARTATAALPPATRQVFPHLGGYPNATPAYAAPRRRPRCTATRNSGSRS